MTLTNTNTGSPADRLEQLLGQPQFEGLKPILERLSPGRELPSLAAAAISYAELLARLGYRLTIVRQIHVQDCYERLGGGGRHQGGVAISRYCNANFPAHLGELRCHRDEHAQIRRILRGAIS